MYSKTVSVSSFNTHGDAIDSRQSVIIAGKGGFIRHRPHVCGEPCSFYRYQKEIKPYDNKGFIRKLLIACFAKDPMYCVTRNAFVLYYDRKIKGHTLNYKLLVCLPKASVSKFIRRLFNDTTRTVNTGLIAEILRPAVNAALDENLETINLDQFAGSRTPVLSVSRLNAVKAAAVDLGMAILQDELVIS